jgi:putative transposase
MRNPFRYFNSSPEVIRLTVMMYVRYPLSLRQVEDLLFERGMDICHETVRFWWNRFGPMSAAAIRKRRLQNQSYSRWRWHLDEVFVRINGETHYLWRAVDHEGEVLEVFATKRRDRRAALEFLKRALKRYGGPGTIVTDRLRSYGAAVKAIGHRGPSAMWALAQQPGRKLTSARSDEKRLPRRTSGTSRPCRSLPPFTPLSKTTFNRTATSTAAASSSRTARSLWPSGVSLQPEVSGSGRFGDQFALD